jgi:hypothetical protein
MMVSSSGIGIVQKRIPSNFEEGSHKRILGWRSKTFFGTTKM